MVLEKKINLVTLASSPRPRSSLSLALRFLGFCSSTSETLTTSWAESMYSNRCIAIVVWCSTQCVRGLDILKIQFFILHNTDTISFPLFNSRFLRYNKLYLCFHTEVHTGGPDLSDRHLKVYSSEDTCEGGWTTQKHNELTRQPSLSGLLKDRDIVRPHFVRLLYTVVSSQPWHNV